MTALLGPRRFGKTSVLRRLAADLTEVSTIPVDLFDVQTYADVVVRLSTTMRDAVPAVRDPAVELSVQAGIDLGGLQAKLALSPYPPAAPRLPPRAGVRRIGTVGHAGRVHPDPGAVAGQIFALTAGHPPRTMRAADQVWRHTGPGERADHARNRLLADGKLRHDGDGEVVVTDPPLADWLVQRLPL